MDIFVNAMLAFTCGRLWMNKFANDDIMPLIYPSGEKVSFPAYSQVSNKRRVALINMGSEKVWNFNKQRMKINGGSEFEKRHKMIIKHGKNKNRLP